VVRAQRRYQSANVMTKITGAVTLIAIVVFASACSDAATRVAYDIESGSKKLGSAEG
jgi:hypothetical protein